MNLKIGIVGLPNVGKSTLFNALTNANALAANYPFATIEPNIGIVPVPDPRLAKLADLYQAEKIIPATVEFVDIAGLVAGASKGEGLGNKFLAHIRECQIICHVVRAFENDDITHVATTIDPRRDIEIIQTELELADLETRERIAAKRKKPGSSGSSSSGSSSPSSGKSNNPNSPNPDNIPFLAEKPAIYLFNISESDLHNQQKQQQLQSIIMPHKAVFVNVKLEEELSKLSPEEKQEFLKDYGLKHDALAELVQTAYDALGLQSFLTAGKKEVRAWTIKKGSTAPEAAGAIHTDFQRGFIAAEVMKYQDLVALGSEQAVKSAGKLATVGKTYIMSDGDIVEFRFNV